MKKIKQQVKVIKKITKPKAVLSREELPLKKQRNYFTIKELCKSDSAEKYNIDNTPDEEITKHLKELIVFLNPLRELWGSAIHINSGYRCEELNKKVGGAENSSHKYGWAVDMRDTKGTRKDFYDFVIDYLKDKDYDECFIEKSKTSTWVHFALKGKNGVQRKKSGTIYT